jgi:hypothetical protein
VKKILYKMAKAYLIRNGIIDILLSITSQDYLTELYKLIENSSSALQGVKLSEDQILMLKLSENDIKQGKLISQSQIDIEDLKWLKEQ